MGNSINEELIRLSMKQSHFKKNRRLVVTSYTNINKSLQSNADMDRPPEEEAKEGATKNQPPPGLEAESKLMRSIYSGFPSQSSANELDADTGTVAHNASSFQGAGNAHNQSSASIQYSQSVMQGDGARRTSKFKPVQNLIQKMEDNLKQNQQLQSLKGKMLLFDLHYSSSMSNLTQRQATQRETCQSPLSYFKRVQSPRFQLLNARKGSHNIK